MKATPGDREFWIRAARITVKWSALLVTSVAAFLPTATRLCLAGAFFLAPRERDDIEHLDAFMRVVAVDDEFTTLGLTACSILNHNPQTRSRM